MFEIILQTIPLFSRIIPENSKIQYVYILGESSAHGVPYQSKISFAKIVKYISANKIDDKDIKIINLAVPTVRIVHQYYTYLIYRYLHPFNKGIVIVYAGTNDISYCNANKKYYFFYNFNLMQIISAYTSKAYDFQYIYETIIKLSKKFGDDIYVSTIAGNYAGFMPDNVNPLKENQTLMNKLINIDNLFFQGNYEHALALCRKNFDNNNKQYFFYRIGKIYEKQGKIKEANDFYINAINIPNSDVVRLRPTTYQNEIIKSLAYKYSIECLDIFDKLYNSNETMGYNFFIDKIHPTIRLNLMIAEGFTDLICQKYKIKKINIKLTEEQIKKIFDFSSEDLFRAYVQALSEIFVCKYRNGILDKYSLYEIRKYILNIKNLNLTAVQEKEEQQKTVEFLEKTLEYISNPNVRNELKDIIKNIYTYGLYKKYAYAINFDFTDILKESQII
jgi:hypothetical protein